MLALFTSGNAGQARGFVFLGAGGQIFERGFVLQTGQPFWRGMEVQAQGAFDGDLVVAKILVVEHLADHELLPLLALSCHTGRIARGRRVGDGDDLAILIEQHPAAGAFLKLAVQAGDVANVVRVFGTELFCRIDDLCKTIDPQLMAELQKQYQRRRQQRAACLPLSELATLVALFHLVLFRLASSSLTRVRGTPTPVAPSLQSLAFTPHPP